MTISTRFTRLVGTNARQRDTPCRCSAALRQGLRLALRRNTLLFVPVMVQVVGTRGLQQSCALDAKPISFLAWAHPWAYYNCELGNPVAYRSSRSAATGGR